jgi:hypothetical protein
MREMRLDILGNAPRVRASRANVVRARQEGKEPVTRPARFWPHRSDNRHMDGAGRKVNDGETLGARTLAAVIARSRRASRDARLSTGYRDAAIQSHRRGPTFSFIASLRAQ